MKKLTILSFILFNCAVTLSQEILPRGFAPGEKEQMPAYINQVTGSEGYGITTPPGGSLRTMAEWEEVQALLISWSGQRIVLAQIIDAAQEECTVMVFCKDYNSSYDTSSAKSYLISNGISLNNVEFYAPGNNSIWIRDFGASTVYRNDVDSLILIDWIYNRPRPKDDVMPQFYAQLLGIPLYETTAPPTDFVNTGGNFFTDGLGRAFCSELVLDENEPGNPYNVTPKTNAAIDSIMNNFMGIKEYVKMTVLPYDNIHHIDMHMKLLDEQTLLVGEYPIGVSDGPQIESNLQQFLSNYNSTFGTPYKVVRIPMPPSTSGDYPANGAYYRTYTNLVFVNETAIVPTYRPEYDTIAMRILREHLPGYNIVPIDSDDPPGVIIALSGAIHCVTRLIGVADPLWIVHQPIDSADVNNIQLAARIQHRTGIASGTIYYTTDTLQPFLTQSMYLANVNTHQWKAQLTGLQSGDTVYYYIKATANNSKQQTRPITAPAGYFDFVVTGSPNTGIFEKQISVSDLFPNPADELTYLKLSGFQGKTISLNLFSALGRLIKPLYSGYIYQNNRNFFINVADLSAGIYFIKVTTAGGKKWTKKLVIK